MHELASRRARRSGTRVRHRTQSGFSLIELALAIVVIALLLGALLVPLGTQVEQRKIAETQRALEEIKEALLGYAMINGNLPRPSPSTVFPGSAISGMASTTDCAGANADRLCTGYLPWSTLGVERTDAWGKLFRYSVTPDLTKAPSSINLAVTSGDRILCNQAPSTIANDCDGVAGADPPTAKLAEKIAAVVISHGMRNHGSAVLGNILQLPYPDSSATNLNEDRNADDNNHTHFFARPYASNPGALGGEFDDIVVSIPTSILMNRLVAAGKLPNS
jgi:prepilin-type N-terminal cleavage/methylation domain-containing protein